MIKLNITNIGLNITNSGEGKLIGNQYFMIYNLFYM